MPSNRTARRLTLIATGALLVASPLHATDVLVPAGSVWSYLDDGSDQGTAWSEVAFDASAWSAGPAELGYGDNDEATVVSYGSDPSQKHITTYFRHVFDVPDASIYVSAAIELVRDDGAVVYLNGVEVARSNLPRGPIDYLTTALQPIVAHSERIFNYFPLDSTHLVTGSNVLAVEIHQRSSSDSDISLDLVLTAETTNTITRGPYLQLGTPTEISVRWRTALPTDSRVWIGPLPGSLAIAADDPTVTTEHEVRVTGLSSNTRYAYAVGSSAEVLAGDDLDHFFVTAPTAGTARPTRIWVLGDSGTANANAAAVRDAYYAYTGSTHTSLWLMLGDNAYVSGTDSEYRAAVFQMYPEMLRKSVLWPTRGNHEADPAVYYGIFTMATTAEAGGIPSGSEAYYSFDYANVHFVCLDSFGSDRAVGGAMWTWADADLASTEQDWIIAFWHHPPYSKGSNDSDVETELREMRENFVPLLESHGVDLVLAGHNHSYERSYLLDGHYGNSTTLTPEMLLSNGDGRPDGDGAYEQVAGPHAGAVYCVAGSSGQAAGGAPLNHPAMFFSLARLGSLVIDVDGDELSAVFLDDDQIETDYFTMRFNGFPLCFGDGSGPACPCGNDSPTAGEGCLHSGGVGMTIGGTGTTSVTADNLGMVAQGCPVANTGLFYSGRTPLVSPLPLYDGLQCVGGEVRRFQGLFQASGSAEDSGFVAQDPSGIYFQPGLSYYFQYWSRDVSAGPTPCGTSANFSPAYGVTMSP